MLSSLEINWEAVVEQLEEETVYAPLLRVYCYFVYVKLMCFTHQVVQKHKDLLVGLDLA